MSHIDAILIFTPPYVYTELQPGIAAVAGYADKAGLATKTIDANIAGLEYVLKNIDNDSAEKSISVLMDSRSYLPENFELFKNAKDTIEELSMKASLRYGEEFRLRRNTVLYIPKYDTQNREGLIKGIQNMSENIFYPYFENELLPKLKALYQESNFKVVGIAITDRKQAIPGFIISKIIKENLPQVKTVIGGNYISRSRDVFKKNDELNRELFKYVDFMVYLEADRAFSELVKALKNGSDISIIEKLIWLQDGEVKSTGKSVISLDDLPLPNYEGLKSWTPEPVPSYNFQRGCNYGLCNFCGLMDGYDSYSMRTSENPTFFIRRRKNTAAIISDLKELSKKYRFINFTDETFFGRDQVNLSQMFIENNLDIKWTSYDRVEKEFEDKNSCRVIVNGGCTFKQFGVESTSVKSLDNMVKGVDNANVYSILRNTHDAGIMNHVFLLIGYPGETVQEALMLFPFLEKTMDYTFTIKPTWYKLSRGSPDSLMTNLKGIERLYTEGDLAPNLHFRPTVGMSKKVAESVCDALQCWINRYHIINYVSGTYCYSQRFFSGYDGILKVVDKIKIGEIKRPPEFTADAPLTVRESASLKQIWGALVGDDFKKINSKYSDGNKNPKLVEAYEKAMQENSVAREFASGFHKIEDVMYMAKKLSDPSI